MYYVFSLYLYDLIFIIIQIETKATLLNNLLGMHIPNSKVQNNRI